MINRITLNLKRASHERSSSAPVPSWGVKVFGSLSSNDNTLDTLVASGGSFIEMSTFQKKGNGDLETVTY